MLGGTLVYPKFELFLTMGLSSTLPPHAKRGYHASGRYYGPDHEMVRK